MPDRIVFVDIETTGLDPHRHDVWEIAAIVRDPGQLDVEHCWMIRPDLVASDPAALRISRYYQRTAGPGLHATGDAIVTAGPDEGLPPQELHTTDDFFVRQTNFILRTPINHHFGLIRQTLF